jgi:hypothetical protein
MVLGCDVGGLARKAASFVLVAGLLRLGIIRHLALLSMRGAPLLLASDAIPRGKDRGSVKGRAWDGPGCELKAGGGQCLAGGRD